MPATGRNRMEYHMPRQPRNPGPPSVYFAVFGLGEASMENITQLLDDYIEGAGEITPKFIIPVDKDLCTATIQDVSAYAANADYSYEAVHVDAFGRTKALKAVGDGAAKVSKVESIEEALIERLIEAGQDGILLFLWDEDSEQVPNEEDQRFLYEVFERSPDTLVLELSGGLEPINPPDASESAEDGANGEAEEAAAQLAQAPPRAGRRGDVVRGGRWVGDPEVAGVGTGRGHPRGGRAHLEADRRDEQGRHPGLLLPGGRKPGHRARAGARAGAPGAVPYPGHAQHRGCRSPEGPCTCPAGP